MILARIRLLVMLAVLCSAHAGGTEFKLLSRLTPIPENGAVTNTVWLCNGIEAAFFPPQGWRLRIDTNDHSLSWTSPDFSSTLTIKIPPADRQAPAPDPTRTLLSRFEGARIKEEFQCFTRGDSGRSIDFETVTAERFVWMNRLSVVPLSQGHAEILLSSPADRFQNLELTYGRFLNSLRLGPTVAAARTIKTP